MKYDEKLIGIIRSKNFKTIWHCIDYLLLADYNILEAFDISMKEYGGQKLFSRVAFVRCEKATVISSITYTPVNNYLVTVGLIDDTNIHLYGLYKIYRKWLNEVRPNKTNFKTNIIDSDIEKTCEIIKVPNVTPLILEFLEDEYLDQFRHKIYVEKPIATAPPPITMPPYIGDLPIDYDEINDTFMKKIGEIIKEQKMRDEGKGYEGEFLETK